MINGGLYILAANTGCRQDCARITNRRCRLPSEDSSVLFITLEMDESQLTARRLARVAKVPASHLIMQRLSDDEYEHIRQQLPALKQKHLVFSSEGVFTVSNIQALAGQVPNLRLVIIDYLGLLQSEPYCGNRYEATTAISNALKALARLLGVPILCLAQLNRSQCTASGQASDLGRLARLWLNRTGCRWCSAFCIDLICMLLALSLPIRK